MSPLIYATKFHFKIHTKAAHTKKNKKRKENQIFSLKNGAKMKRKKSSRYDK